MVGLSESLFDIQLHLSLEEFLLEVEEELLFVAQGVYQVLQNILLQTLLSPYGRQLQVGLLFVLFYDLGVVLEYSHAVLQVADHLVESP